MSDAAAGVGVVLVGHGRTASELLRAAEGIVGAGALHGVVPVDAGQGETAGLGEQLCDVIEKVDAGSGVLVLVDLWGASPCTCAQREARASEHRIVTLSGLNLAMLLKLAAIDREQLDVEALASACADSGRRAVQVKVEPKPSSQESQA